MINYRHLKAAVDDMEAVLNRAIAIGTYTWLLAMTSQYQEDIPKTTISM